MDDSLLPVTSLRENLTQTHLDFSYFRTTEPKLTPALRKMPLTDLRHTIWTGDAYHPQTIICRGKGTQIILRNTSGSVKLHFIQYFNALNKKST